MEACPIEVDHGRVRYTYETILEIKELYPCYDIFLLWERINFPASTFGGIQANLLTLYTFSFLTGKVALPNQLCPKAYK